MGRPKQLLGFGGLSLGEIVAAALQASQDEAGFVLLGNGEFPRGGPHAAARLPDAISLRALVNKPGIKQVIIDAFEQAGDRPSLDFDDVSCESFDSVFIHTSAGIRRYPGCGNPNQYLVSEKQRKQEES